MKKLNLLLLGGLTLGFVACSGDDDATAPSLEVPATYTFSRNGESSVSFGGQTTRLKQGAEILTDLKSGYGLSETDIDNKFENGAGFSDVSLNGTGKAILSKVAESVDYFSSNSSEQAKIRGDFQKYIADQVANILGVYASADDVPVATKGSVGKLGSRLVTANGLELDQAFNKGLIGALILDQVINDYLSLTEDVDLRAAHDEDKLVEGKNYTTLEHYWDEAYGYVYGASDADVLDNPDSRHLDKDNVVDKFLYKYVQRVEADGDFQGLAATVFNAFKTGRAALVAKDYDASVVQANIIRKALSEVIGIRSVYYLKQGAKKITENGQSALDDGSAFHDWSEGYGFIYSLRFTQNPDTGAPYFTKEEVDTFVAKLDANDGFWTLADNLADVNKMADDIAAKFSFTVAQAESSDKVN